STNRPAQAADSASHAASAALAVHPSAPENDSASGDFGRGARDSTAARRTGPDSAIRIQIATQPKSRTKADSISLVAAIRTGLSTSGWPVKTPALLAGSILPAKRIVAFYGNPLSKRMGILGEIPYDQMLTKLDSVVAAWRAADPTTPVQPALHLIVSVAQGTPGKDGMYRQ